MTTSRFVRRPRNSTCAAAFVLLTALAGLTGTVAHAAWPTQTVRIIVGYPPGSTPDVQARLVAEPLAKALGQTVIVENKPGAGGTLGVDAVAKATDGHTIGVTGNGPLTTASLLYKKLPYNVSRDLKAIAMVADAPQVLAVRGDLPVKSVAEFIALAKKGGKGITYGSVGNGSGSHLTMELLKSELGFEALHVAYPGFPQVTTALLGGQIDAAIMVPSSVLAQAESKKLNLIAVTAKERAPFLPKVPTVAEQTGLKTFSAPVWNGVFAPTAISAEASTRLSAAVQTIVNSADFKAKMISQGWVANAGNAEDMAARMARDGNQWGTIIKQRNVQLD